MENVRIGLGKNADVGTATLFVPVKYFDQVKYFLPVKSYKHLLL